MGLQIIFSCILFILSIQAQDDDWKQLQLHYLTTQDNVRYCDNMHVNTKQPSIYCYKGKQKEIRSTWETVFISVKLNDDLFEQFEGNTPDDVMKKFQKHQSSWSANIFSFWKRNLIKLDPFNTTCVGILTQKSYQISLISNEFDFTQFAKFVGGMFLFLYAKKLSQNQIFYYLCGITLGICGSVLVLIYLITRMFPNKPLMYGFVVGGWTISYYFLQYLLDNAKLITLQYKEYVLGYIALSGLISFALCYRFGPLTNPRSRNLIQWLLQIVGLGLIFFSSYLYEITYMIDLVLVISRVMPFSLIFSGIRFVKNKLFRPKVKLLTKKEYFEQGRKETKKALEELRGYCSSPECNTWKTVLRLKNPVKFAEFMEGSNHLSDEEINDYDSLSIKPNGTIITDDSDSVEEYSELNEPRRKKR